MYACSGAGISSSFPCRSTQTNWRDSVTPKPLPGTNTSVPLWATSNTAAPLPTRLVPVKSTLSTIGTAPPRTARVRTSKPTPNMSPLLDVQEPIALNQPPVGGILHHDRTSGLARRLHDDCRALPG